LRLEALIFWNFMNKSVKDFFVFISFFRIPCIPTFSSVRGPVLSPINPVLVHLVRGVICSKTVNAKSDIAFLALCLHDG